jgi:Transposase and inactivated derivatives
MKKKNQFPKHLLQAIRYFTDIDVCTDFVAALRWPNGVQCPHCAGLKVSYLSSRRIWKCMKKECHKQFSVKTGSVFEDSPIPLDKWLIAVWLVVNCKNGISSYEIMRHLDVTQKSAWFMLHRIRLALREGNWSKLGGEDGSPVEMDETFIGGKVSNMHKRKKPARASKGRGIAGKAIVVGMLERKGRVCAEVVMDRTQPILHALARKHLADGTTLITDEWGGYKGTDFEHQIINHAESYVRESVHTNGIENFWSLLKRGLSGTYISVEPFHLFRYIDEQAFRYNNRATEDNPLDEADRFVLAVSQISGKRLTYAELTGKVQETGTETLDA